MPSINAHVTRYSKFRVAGFRITGMLLSLVHNATALYFHDQTTFMTTVYGMEDAENRTGPESPARAPTG